MKKVVIILILILSLLIGCGNNIDGAVVVDLNEAPSTEAQLDRQKLIEISEEKTAAEMMNELKDSTEVKQEVKTGTFYGDIEVEGEGKDALKAKTRALFEREFFDLNVEADTKTGPRYH